MSAKWSLDPREVRYSATGLSSGKRSQLSRRLKITSFAIALTHTPTGLEVQGQVPPGNYSKKEMQNFRKALYQQLFSELEVKVAKRLRVPGR